MTDVSEISTRANEVSLNDLGPLGDSVQFMFAKLQLAECRQCRENAQSRMKDIGTIQKEQAYSNEMMSKIKDFIKSGKGEPPKEMVAFCTERGIPLPDGTQTKATHMSEKLVRFLCSGIFSKATTDIIVKFTKSMAEWSAEVTGPNKSGSSSSAIGLGYLLADNALGLLGFLVAKACGSDITWDETFTTYKGSVHFDQKDWETSSQNIHDFKENEGAKIPAYMLYVQNFLGQYNAFLQGASTAIAQGVQVTSALTKNG